MDLSLAKSLASHGAVKGFYVYHDKDIDEWFFNVLTITSHPDDDGVPFSTARGDLKRFRSLDSLMRDVIAIIESDDGRLSIPVLVHVS
jgi:hypothetical protein